jgi:hypothetical protein
MSNRKLVIKVIAFVLAEYGLPQSRPTVLKKYFDKYPEDDALAMEIRFERFRQDVLSYRVQFPDATLKEFFERWTEKSINGKKYKWERESTWDTKKRLVTWYKNEVTNRGKFPEKWDNKNDKPMGALEVNQSRSWNKTA